MATARHLHPHLKDSSAPNIDVYSTSVVVYEAETFDWTISGQDGQASVTVQPLAGQSWPFTPSSFSVTRGNGTPATVTGTPGNYQFQCNPAAPTSPQNSGNPAIVIQAAHLATWPLVQGAPVIIQGNSTQIVQVSPNAAVGDYPITVTMQQGGTGVCPQAGDPKIIVTAPNKPK
jgi:hypothetical protein